MIFSRNASGYSYKIYRKIKNHLSKKEISIISGIRQCGKSTVLFQLKSDLEKKRLKEVLGAVQVELREMLKEFNQSSSVH